MSSSRTQALAPTARSHVRELSRRPAADAAGVGVAGVLHRQSGMTTTTMIPRNPARHAALPEQHLMAAVLNDALDVIAQPDALSRRRVVRETHEWFASDDTAWPFSLRNVCTRLGIDPLAIRAVVARHADARHTHRLAA